jgi:transposase InsO family protein
LKQHRSTHRYVPKSRDDEVRLVQDMIELARQYGRYGYRRIAAMLRDAGWQLNDKRVERLSRHEGLKFLMKQSSGSVALLSVDFGTTSRPTDRNQERPG